MSTSSASAATVIPATEQYSTIEPVIPHTAHLGLTILFTTIYALVFLMIFVQLFLILYYRHRRLSGQSVFLFVCLIWSALRTTLFSFYFENCVQANGLSRLPRWILIAFPVYLQFLILCLLAVYFGKVTRLTLAKRRRYCSSCSSSVYSRSQKQNRTTERLSSATSICVCELLMFRINNYSNN